MLHGVRCRSPVVGGALRLGLALMSPGLGVGVVGLGEYNPVAKSVFEKGGVEVSAVVVVVVEVVMVVVIEVVMVVTVDSCGLGFRTASLTCSGVRA